MTEQEIRSVVEQVLRRMEKSTAGAPQQTAGSTDAISDIRDVDIRQQYLVENAKDSSAFRVMKERTPARIGVGHCGARYRTETMLRFQADHAAAQASVFSDVPQEWLDKQGWPCFQTTCETRDMFLTRPDKGRVFSDEVLRSIRSRIPSDARVVLYVADGLSSSAVLHNAEDLVPVIRKGLEGYGIKTNEPFFVRFGRVATEDQIGDGLNAEVVCVLLGERPGLVTANSMSAYIAYKPTVGMPESRRTVLANIHSGGTPAVEAGAHIVELIRLMLEKKASGIDLPI